MEYHTLKTNLEDALLLTIWERLYRILSQVLFMVNPSSKKLQVLEQYFGKRESNISLKSPKSVPIHSTIIAWFFCATESYEALGIFVVTGNKAVFWSLTNRDVLEIDLQAVCKIQPALCPRSLLFQLTHHVAQQKHIFRDITDNPKRCMKVIQKQAINIGASIQISKEAAKENGEYSRETHHGQQCLKYTQIVRSLMLPRAQVLFDYKCFKNKLLSEYGHLLITELHVCYVSKNRKKYFAIPFSSITNIKKTQSLHAAKITIHTTSKKHSFYEVHKHDKQCMDDLIQAWSHATAPNNSM
mmetsp:Transcript_9756/g.13423  ORF Transcript_9756/g.13423 Transcript_9756/m.13423 type:complete len:299 (+) Transcript_9756:1-897(+)